MFSVMINKLGWCEGGRINGRALQDSGSNFKDSKPLHLIGGRRENLNAQSASSIKELEFCDDGSTG